jgi:hypothetical protein
MKEYFLAEEKLLRGYQDKLQERKSNPGKGNKIATRSSWMVKGGDYNVGFKQCFQMPKNQWNLMVAELEEQKQRSGGILDDILKETRVNKVCLRCDIKNYTK